MEATRRVARRTVPFTLRAQLVLARRALADRRAGLRFSTRTGRIDDFPFVLSSYERPFVDYPGQEQLGQAKRHNQRVMAAFLERCLIGPDEVFSLWRLAGKPTARSGYLHATALKDRRLTTEIGGATCLLSTVVYNTALLGAMQILERRCHSVDSHGDDRYFEVGRDATIEWPYIDLRFRNPHPFPVLLSFDISVAALRAKLLSPVKRDFDVEILVVDVERLPPPGQAMTSSRAVPADRSSSVAGLP